MKHIFLLNPIAGKGKASVELLPQIIAAVKARKVDYEIHRTVNVGDAKRYVRERCEENPEETLRFYACGGDGTMNEVLNGLYGFPNAQLAVIPAGTGNDLVRNFSNWKRFRDIGKQIDGISVPLDVIQYELLSGEGPNPDTQLASSGYALNMYNMGFDAEVVAKTSEIKGKPLMSGTAAYVGGVGIVLAKLKKLELSVEVDGELLEDAQYLLAGVANGRFSGGGFDGMPVARLDDGFMDVLLVCSVTRRFFLSIVKKYHDGTHMDILKEKGVLRHFPCREAVIRPKSDMIMAIDGETSTVGAVRFKLMPQAVHFSIPAE